jgi:hypothetical protein
MIFELLLERGKRRLAPSWSRDLKAHADKCNTAGEWN